MNKRFLQIELCSQCKYYLASFQGGPYCFKMVDPMKSDPLGRVSGKAIPADCPLPKA